jgi:hypothetical protein
MSNRVDITDWHAHHVLTAGARGWCLSEVGLSGTPHFLEVQRLDDAAGVSVDWGIQVPQLSGDDHAVQVFKQAWLNGEDHATLAYQILKHASPSEFEYWHMNTWRRD